ncbi:MAG: hypothetical protein ACR2JE_00135 [Acidobacteriaceae bacterium]
MLVLAGAAGAQITVDAPAGNDPYVNSPFYLQAEAATCNGLPTSSMAWSYDSNPDNLFSGSQSIQTMVAISNDNTPTLRVKAWNTNGALCETNLQLNIGGGVTVSSPGQGSGVSSPFTLSASAPTCGGQTTSSMAWSDNTRTDQKFSGAKSINTSITAPGGWDILRAKAWGTGGSYCETDVHIDVGGNGQPGIIPPANAFSFAHLENDGTYTGAYASCGGATGPHSSLWQTQPDCATYKSQGYQAPAGSTAQVSSPVFGSNSISRQFAMTNYYHSGEGVRWFDAKPDNTNLEAASNFLYDAWVYIPDVSKVMNIEMDVNHTVSSGTTFILAAQCSVNIGTGVWEMTSSSGWLVTNAPCTPQVVTSNAWHHLQIQTHHDSSGVIHYDQVAVDGVITSNLTCTPKGGGTATAAACNSAGKKLGWGAGMGPNFQLDGLGTPTPPSSYSATAYVDNYTIYYW